ncbi:retrovirus-related pol polyprotein from transposon TNT 1-94 [Tanacetum coccineum]
MNINDPLYIASSDHPGMILTNTPFNGSNFHGWSRNIKMALGAKLKLGFIDGSCVKPASDHDDLQRWIGCDYMVTCWILNSMVTELLDVFLYAQSACELWKEIRERYGQSNGQLVYQLEGELSKISQSNLLVASYFNKLKKCWDELHNINGMPTCNCGKMRECTCSVLEKFALRDTAFFANMNNKNDSNGRRENNKGNTNEIKGETKNEISFKKVCTNYGQEGHLFEQSFERLGYPDWYKGKKAKKNNRLAEHVNSGFDGHFSGETPFDMGYENEIVAVGKGSKNLYICKPTLDQATFDAQVFAFCKTYQNVILVHCFNKNAFSNYVSKHYVDIKTFNKRLAYTSVSKLVHIPQYRHLDVSSFSCECCLLSKHHRLPFQRSTSIAKNPFDLIHVDLWGPFKHPAQDGAHYFYTIVDDHARATWTYLVHSKTQVYDLLVSFLAYVTNHFKTSVKIIMSDNGTEIVNAACNSLFMTKGVLHQRSMAYTPQQNGVVERKHRHLLDTVKAIRLHANLSIKFWGDCVLAATYLINKMPMEILEWKSPYEKLFGQPPVYDHLRVIGCLCYAVVTIPQKDKFDNRGIKCVLLGYPMNQKGYKLYNL